MTELFRTVIDVPKPGKQLTYSDKIILMGSCFADNIGSRLKEYKFPVKHNPFGVLYNPLSVKKNLESLINQKLFKETDLHFHNDLWFSFQHHSSFSHPDKLVCLEKINSSLTETSGFLRDAGFLFITFGTAWVYEHKADNSIVANCHKLPANEFNRYLLSVDDIIQNYDQLISRLKELNPDLKLVFTVSPIRHWKDGAVNNQVSKSTLILAIHKLTEKYPDVEYFPAYEIFMDELRDYRFYGNDMLHPSETAVEYTWKIFSDTYIDNASKLLMKEIRKINKAENHRPMNPATTSYQEFLKSTIRKIESLQKNHPYLNLEKDLHYFTMQLKEYFV